MRQLCSFMSNMSYLRESWTDLRATPPRPCQWTWWCPTGACTALTDSPTAFYHKIDPHLNWILHNTHQFSLCFEHFYIFSCKKCAFFAIFEQFCIDFTGHMRATKNWRVVFKSILWKLGAILKILVKKY